jgi:hypothetical protein
VGPALADIVPVLTAIGVLATAVFTGLALVLGWIVHQHAKSQAGRRKPFRVVLRPVERPAGNAHIYKPDDAPLSNVRGVEIQLTNHSGVAVTAGPIRARVWWPPGVRVDFQRYQRVYGSQDFANVVFALTSKEPWATQPDDGMFYKTFCWFSATFVISETGKKFRARGRVKTYCPRV